MSNLATTNGTSPIAMWDASQIELIKNQIAKGCSDGELALFGQVCQRTGLDPFSRQIYAISRNVWDKETGKSEPRLTIQVSIDGFRTIAARSGLYGGSTTEWCGEDGLWRDVWLSNKPPTAAKTTVWRIGSPHPFTGVARFESYAQSFKGKLSGLWEKLPDVMISKCSESLALRKAFPAELSGLYSSEEMEQSDNVEMPSNQPFTPTLSSTAAQYHADLKKAFEILEWDADRRNSWIRKINPTPNTKWSDADWSNMISKAYAEVDKVNDLVAVVAEVV